MATIYGTEIGIPPNALIAAILRVQFVGLPCSFLFGSIAEHLGTKGAIFLALAIYVTISIIGYFMQTAIHFSLVAILVFFIAGGLLLARVDVAEGQRMAREAS
jgi:UMF1 family MFS transporter